MTSTRSKVAIVGAGVFGLSTALHLKKRGYEDVTVFDYQPYDKNGYDPDDGCDAASADVNKIYRCSYGDEKAYQDLAYSGLPIWQEWNQQIASTRPEDLPHGLTPKDELLVQCGYLRMCHGEELSTYDQMCLDELDKAGLRHFQHVIKDADDMSRLMDLDAASSSTWLLKSHALRRASGGKLNGFLDISAGLTYANKACTWVRHLCERAGLKFVLGSICGKLDDLLVESTDQGRRVTGLRTADGVEHMADVLIVACGGWTPSLVPEAGQTLEATAGSIITIDLPRTRQDLWDKFSPDNFPVWSYGLTGHNSPEYGGFYGFPRTPSGKIKIGYRGRKWTNHQVHPKTGKRISVPKTKYSQEKAENLPKKAIDHVKKLLGELFPELLEIGISDTRLCWYTDSIDNSFLIDYVPGYSETLFVASGGSGHGFKFLPVLGEHVVNALERKPDQFTDLWKWRFRNPGERANGLEESEEGERNLAGLEMAKVTDWIWTKPVAVDPAPMSS